MEEASEQKEAPPPVTEEDLTAFVAQKEQQQCTVYQAVGYLAAK